MGGVARGVSRVLTSMWEWLERHPVRALLIAIALSAALRLPFLTSPLSADEGGFLLVADQWDNGGDSLYGDLWVDRPPLLIVVFKLAVWLGGSIPVVRILAFVFACVTITAAWWAGRLINEQRGAVAAALVAAAIGANVSLDGTWLTGETIGSSFVMSSVALTLSATYGSAKTQRQVLFAALAGVLASCAFLVKQSLVDAGIFAFVLLCLKLHRRWPQLLAGAVGLALPLLLTVAWARSDHGPGVERLWNAIYRFRQRALDIMNAADGSAPAERAREFLITAVLVGVAVLIVQTILASFAAPQRKSLRTAVLVLLGYEVAAIVLGANWWPHYGLQLIPAFALGTALATHAHVRRKALPRVVTHLGTVYAVTAAVVTAVLISSLIAAGRHGNYGDDAVADYLEDAAGPGDSVFVAYGTPSIIWRAGLTTPYRYVWSLPIRGRDPHLKNLVATLEGPDAPTWLVEMDTFDWWDIDTMDFRLVRLYRYHFVAQICGKTVYLLDDAGPRRPPTPEEFSCDQP